MTKKESDKIESLILQRLDTMEKKFDDKLDLILETAIPNLKTEVALIKDRSGRFAIIISAVGGALALLTSAGVAMWLK